MFAAFHGLEWGSSPLERDTLFERVAEPYKGGASLEGSVVLYMSK